MRNSTDRDQPDRAVVSPLTVGKTWEMKYHERRPQDRQTEDIERACSAEAEEAVTVPAGSFATVRIACKNTRNGAWVLTVWYAPQVKHFVREESAVPEDEGYGSFWCTVSGNGLPTCGKACHPFRLVEVEGPRLLARPSSLRPVTHFLGSTLVPTYPDPRLSKHDGSNHHPSESGALGS